MTLEQGGAPWGALAEFGAAFVAGGVGVGVAAWALGVGALFTRRGPVAPVAENRSIRSLSNVAAAALRRLTRRESGVGSRRPLDPPRPAPRLSPARVDPMAAASDGVDRAAWLALAICHAVSGPVFLWLFRTPATAWWQDHTARFFPMIALYAAPFVARGIDAARAWPPLEPRRLLRVGLSWIAVVAVAALPFGPSRGRDSLRAYIDAVFAEVAPHAIVIGSEDGTVAAAWEAQFARRVRPDVTFVAAPLLAAPWYAEQVMRALPGYRHPPRAAGIRLIVAWAHAHGRPVCTLEPPPPALARQLRVIDDGLCMRVLPRDAAPPTLAEVGRALDRLPSPPSLADWQWPTATDRWIAARFRRPWLTLCAARLHAKEIADPAQCRGLEAAP